MLAKEIVEKKEGHERLLSGIKKLSSAVGCTFGPAGRHVLIQKNDGFMHISKDGVTVASEIMLEDQIENSGATALIDIATYTVNRAGDGTTTSILLAAAMYEAGLQRIDQFTNKTFKDMRKIGKLLVDKLNEIAFDGHDPDILEAVANISSNNDEEISKLIRKAVESIGDEGNIFVENGKGTETILENTPGIGFLAGYVSHYFINNLKRSQNILHNPYVLITDEKIYSVRQLQNLLEQLHRNRDESSSILIICHEIVDVPLDFLLSNLGHIQACVVQLSGEKGFIQEFMDDLAIVCGCTPIGGKFTKVLGTGSEQVMLSDLGRISKSIVSKDKTILLPLDENLDKIVTKQNQLKELLKDETDPQNRILLRQRIGRLSDGLAILTVGGLTEQSRKERNDLIEDAVCATMVARENGVLPGAGAPYQFLSTYLDVLKKDESYNFDELAFDILHVALENIYTRLKLNYSELEINNDMNPSNWVGYNLRNDEVKLLNLKEEKILEPVSVIAEALQNSIEVSSLLLHTDNFVIYSQVNQKHFNGFPAFNPFSGKQHNVAGPCRPERLF